MQSWVFQQGRQEGELRGKLEGKLEGAQRSVCHLYELRLTRPLTDDERATVAKRLPVLGSDRLIDIGAGFTAEALAAWLQDPLAT